jgi:hypothetical protein
MLDPGPPSQEDLVQACCSRCFDGVEEQRNRFFGFLHGYQQFGQLDRQSAANIQIPLFKRPMTMLPQPLDGVSAQDTRQRVRLRYRVISEVACPDPERCDSA